MEDIRAFADTWLSNPWIRAALIVAVSLVAAKITDVVVCRALRKLTARTASNFDDRIIDVLHRPLFLSVLFIGLGAATVTLGMAGPFETAVVRLLKTIALMVWTIAAIRILRVVFDGMDSLAERAAWLDTRTIPLFDNVAKLVVVGLAVFFLLAIWNINPAPWLASAGIVGLALGFAAKDSLANLFGGLFILADAPYKIGDFILLDSGERGQVTQIGLRSTRLLTRDDIEVTLPNAQIANAKIVNESGGPYEKARVTVTVGVAYGSDIDRVREVLLQATREVDEIIADPEPRVRFTSFGDSALIFRLLGWIEIPEQRGRALDALNTAVYKKLNAAGIQIPFPQQDVWVKQLPADGD